jgi:hypothetical protein
MGRIQEEPAPEFKGHECPQLKVQLAFSIVKPQQPVDIILPENSTFTARL